MYICALEFKHGHGKMKENPKIKRQFNSLPKLRDKKNLYRPILYFNFERQLRSKTKTKEGRFWGQRMETGGYTWHSKMLILFGRSSISWPISGRKRQFIRGTRRRASRATIATTPPTAAAQTSNHESEPSLYIERYENGRWTIYLLYKFINSILIINISSIVNCTLYSFA